MNSHLVPLIIIAVIILISSIVGLYAGARRKMNLEQWTVGNRGFGLVLVWLLMAGEVYTTFAFLGASGWTYSKGGPTLYTLAYLTLAYVFSFFILPQLWHAGKKHGMQTQSDFFKQRYGSKNLAALVALIGVIFIIPYLQLQLTSLGIIVNVTSYGAISRTWAMIIAFGLVAAFVFVSGVRGVAWISVIKDFLMLFAAVFLGLSLPYIHFGGIHQMFEALVAAKPTHLIMPGATKNLGHTWFVSTVLLTSVGFYMWPHLFSATFTAKDSKTIRKNSVIMPLYSISMPLIFFVGFTALLVVPGLKNGDLALLTLVQKSFPPWFLGVIGAAGALTAMVPAAILTLAASTLFAKNFYREILSPSMSDDQVARLAKILVLVITLITLYVAIFSSTSLVNLLLLGYAGVTQFLPGVLFGLYWRRVTMPSVAAGLIVGISTVAVLVLTKNDPFFGINAGFIALCCNFLITIGVSLVSAPQENRLQRDNKASSLSVETT